MLVLAREGNIWIYGLEGIITTQLKIYNIFALIIIINFDKAISCDAKRQYLYNFRWNIWLSKLIHIARVIHIACAPYNTYKDRRIYCHLPSMLNRRKTSKVEKEQWQNSVQTTTIDCVIHSFICVTRERIRGESAYGAYLSDWEREREQKKGIERERKSDGMGRKACE